MTTVDEGIALDRALLDAFAAEPSGPARDAIDGRVALAMELAAAHRRARVIARPRAPRRRLALGFAVAGLAVVLLAATTNLISLYATMGGDAYRIAWDRGQALGLSETRDGYRVTMERAYADGATLMLALSVVDTQDRGHSQVGAMGVDVALAGDPYHPNFGQSSPLDATAAANVWWFAATELVPAGTRPITVTIPEIGVRDDATPPPSESATWNPWHAVAGPWSFTFDLVVAGGTGVRPDLAATASGLTLRLDSVVISPTAVRARLSIDGAPGDEAWAIVGRVLHNGRLLEHGGGVVGAGSGELTAGTGTEDVSGEWLLVVDELVGMSARTAGPWGFRFSLP